MLQKGGFFSSLPPPGGLMDYGYNTLDILLYGVTMHLMGLYTDLDGQSKKNGYWDTKNRLTLSRPIPVDS